LGVLALAGGAAPTRLLLAGIVAAAGWGAVVTLLLALSPGPTLQGMLLWLMGDLSGAQPPALALGALAGGLLLALALARPLDLLARGELQARSLGLPVGPLRLLLHLAASLLTAAAVWTAGPVGFVGLVVPHLLRLAGARGHGLLLPAAVLAGGGLLVVADTAARTLLAPRELPVGVLTALLGVPLFLYLLRRGRPWA
ncbi:MAG: iron ABC transporter permease, partial [Gammaproteobacteria bacterium]